MTSAHPMGPVRLIWEVISRRADLHPKREALVDGSRRITWRDLQNKVCRLAAVLRRAGVGPGDCVAQISPPCAAFPIAWLATSRIGAIWGGFSPCFSADELQGMLEECAPAALITDLSTPHGLHPDTYRTIRDVSDRLALRLTLGAGPEWQDPDFWETIEEGTDPPADDVSSAETVEDDAPVLLLYTSGSTGRPLGVLHSHRSVLASAAREAELFGIGPDARFLLHFPINHVAAVVEIGYCTLYAGGTLIIRPKFSPDDVLNTIPAENVTVLGQIPAMYAMLFADPGFDLERLRGLRKYLYGSGIMSGDLLETLRALVGRFNAELVTGYGLSEFAGFVSASHPEDMHYPGFAGRPFPDCETGIFDEAGQPVPEGQSGEIWLRGPSRMLGYLNQPGITRKRIDADGWFHTGDIGVLRDGALEILGRRTEMFKNGGENVFPAEIEQVLEAHPAVLAAAVVAVPDPVFGEVAHAYVVPVPGRGLSADALQAHCAGRLAPFKIPRRFYLEERLPLLSSGKVDRAALRIRNNPAAGQEPAS